MLWQGLGGRGSELYHRPPAPKHFNSLSRQIGFIVFGRQSLDILFFYHYSLPLILSFCLPTSCYTFSFLLILSFCAPCPKGKHSKKHLLPVKHTVMLLNNQWGWEVFDFQGNSGQTLTHSYSLILVFKSATKAPWHHPKQGKMWCCFLLYNYHTPV